jgi:hypothetical protein
MTSTIGRAFSHRRLVRDDIPGFCVRAGAARDSLRAVKHTAASDSEYHIYVFLLAYPDSLEDARIILRVRFYPREFINLKAIEKTDDLLIYPCFLYASAPVCQEHLPAERLHHAPQLCDSVFAKNEPCRRHIIKILHN